MCAACVHQYNDCPSSYEPRIMAIGRVDDRDLCCMKCGQQLTVDRSQRWRKIVESWLDNGLHPQDWQDYQDTCYYFRDLNDLYGVSL